MSQKQGGLGQRGASTYPLDLGTPKYNMPPLRPKNEPGTVWRGYDEDSEQERGDNSSSNSSSKLLDERLDGTSSLSFDPGNVSSLGERPACTSRTCRFNSGN